MLSGLQRTPREYKKRKAEYWNCELNQKRAKQKLRMQQSSVEDASSNQVDDNVDKMSAAELREGLKRLGIQTRTRKLTRLQEMYRDALKNQ